MAHIILTVFYIPCALCAKQSRLRAIKVSYILTWFFVSVNKYVFTWWPFVSVFRSQSCWMTRGVKQNVKSCLRTGRRVLPPLTHHNIHTALTTAPQPGETEILICMFLCKIDTFSRVTQELDERQNDVWQRSQVVLDSKSGRVVIWTLCQLLAVWPATDELSQNQRNLKWFISCTELLRLCLPHSLWLAWIQFDLHSF